MAEKCINPCFMKDSLNVELAQKLLKVLTNEIPTGLDNMDGTLLWLFPLNYTLRLDCKCEQC